MNIELILIILLAVLVVILMGVALHLASTIGRLNQYIAELERDLKYSINVLQASGLHEKIRNNDTATTNHQ